MIDQMTAALQVRRFGGLEYFHILPPEALDELVAVLASSETEDVAAQAVSRWIEYNAKRPTPVELRVVVERLNREHLDRIQGHHANCPKCCDVGLVVVDGVFAACSCPTGALPFTRDWIGHRAG
jgi:hypothetical protein